ncbi:hypothetical protein [Streptomyces sp. NPDC051014]|uniref:hypothetical protein n=1 Tax=Streptomyces sp. NPDC051014 TaxID=3155751 RepID=UPI0033E4B1D3
MQFPDGVSGDVEHITSAEVLARAAQEAIEADDLAAASALTSLAHVYATLALAEGQQQMLWVAGDIRGHLENLRSDAVSDIARALRERLG